MGEVNMGVMEVAKDFTVLPEMTLGRLYYAIYELRGMFDKGSFFITHNRLGGQPLKHFTFYGKKHGKRTNYAIYRIASTKLVLESVPEENHSCNECHIIWNTILETIYNYIAKWKSFTTRTSNCISRVAR